MEKCVYRDKEVDLPEDLVTDENVLLEILSETVWRDKLTEGQRRVLMRLLPDFPENDQYEKQETLRSFFSGANFCFGNPRNTFCKKVKEGRFTVQMARHLEAIQDLLRKQAESKQKSYHSRLLKEVLVNAKRARSAYNEVPPGDPVEYEWFSCSHGGDNPGTSVSIDMKVALAFQEMEQEINTQCGMADWYSDDDDILTSLTTESFSQKVLPVDVFTPTVFSTVDSLAATAEGGPAPRAISPVPLSPQILKKMLQNHRKRRMTEPNAPDLDTSGITLESIIRRTYGTSVPDLSSLETMDTALEDFVAPQTKKRVRKAASAGKLRGCRYPNYGQQSCFFVLIRELLLAENPPHLSTHMLEQRISLWQSSRPAHKNSWYGQVADWTKVVAATAHTLMHATHLRLQEGSDMWMWQRGDDNELLMQCNRWVPPPPNQVLKIPSPSSEALRSFHQQEESRFAAPDQPYRYRMENNVVYFVPALTALGQQLGGWSWDTSLLISEAPASVTGLALVHDAAARLPKGVGSRGDVQALLRFSQYINRDVTDIQLMALVSGVLDRLACCPVPWVSFNPGSNTWEYISREPPAKHARVISIEEVKAVDKVSKPRGRAPKVARTKVELTPEPAPVLTMGTGGGQAVSLVPNILQLPRAVGPLLQLQTQPTTASRSVGNLSVAQPVVAQLARLLAPRGAQTQPVLLRATTGAKTLAIVPSDLSLLQTAHPILTQNAGIHQGSVSAALMTPAVSAPVMRPPSTSLLQQQLVAPTRPRKRTPRMQTPTPPTPTIVVTTPLSFVRATTVSKDSKALVWSAQPTIVTTMGQAATVQLLSTLLTTGQARPSVPSSVPLLGFIQRPSVSGSSSIRFLQTAATPVNTYRLLTGAQGCSGAIAQLLTPTVVAGRAKNPGTVARLLAQGGSTQVHEQPLAPRFSMATNLRQVAGAVQMASAAQQVASIGLLQARPVTVLQSQTEPARQTRAIAHRPPIIQRQAVLGVTMQAGTRVTPGPPIRAVRSNPAHRAVIPFDMRTVTTSATSVRSRNRAPTLDFSMIGNVRFANLSPQMRAGVLGRPTGVRVIGHLPGNMPPQQTQDSTAVHVIHVSADNRGVNQPPAHK